MSIGLELKRTVSHFHDDGSESVIQVSLLTFSDGEQVITLMSEHGDDSVMVHADQIDTLVKVLQGLKQQHLE